MNKENIFNFQIEIIHSGFKNTSFKLRWGKIIVEHYFLDQGLAELIRQMRIRKEAYNIIDINLLTNEGHIMDINSLTNEGQEEKKKLEEILSIEQQKEE